MLAILDTGKQIAQRTTPDRPAPLNCPGHLVTLSPGYLVILP
jgi:hypothetical protein